MIYAATGHRPPALGGYNRQTLDRVNLLALRVIQLLRPERVMSGMAQGWDQAIARACLLTKIPYEVALPCRDQDKMWPAAAQQAYQQLVAKAACVHEVTKEPFEPGCMQRRNEYMNAWAKQLAGADLALWSGATGGTANCVHHAHAIELGVFNCWGMWLGQTEKPVQIYAKHWDKHKMGPLPEINIAPDNSWTLTCMGRVVDQGSTSKHRYSLSAAQRARERFINEALDDKPSYVAGPPTAPLPDPFAIEKIENTRRHDDEAQKRQLAALYGPSDDDDVVPEGDPWL